MKKLLILTLLLLIVACAPAPETTDVIEAEAIQEETVQAEVKEEITQEAQPPQPSVKVEEPEIMEDELAISVETQERAEMLIVAAGKRVVISDSYRKYELGELYVYSIGVKNLLVGEDDFLIKLEFDDARDKLGNLLTSDDNLVAGWIGRNNFEIFTLDDGEIVYVPLYIETTQFIDGKTPPKGTYNFDLRVFNADGQDIPRDEYAKIDFTVHIT